MRMLLDTSVLIDEAAPPGVEAAISVLSLTELHFGVLVASDADERARRVGRLASVEATFDPLPISVDVARAGEGSPPRWSLAAVSRVGAGWTSGSRRRPWSPASRC